MLTKLVMTLIASGLLLSGMAADLSPAVTEKILAAEKIDEQTMRQIIAEVVQEKAETTALESQPATNAAQLPTPAGPPWPVVTTTGGDVNIRSCPAVDNSLCPSIGLLTAGNRAEVVGIDPQTGWWNIVFNGRMGWITNAPTLVQITGNTSSLSVSTVTVPAQPGYATEDIRVLFEEMTLVQLLAEEYARVETVCAGIGLKSISPNPEQPMVLLPNAGDLSVDGSNVAIRLDPDGQITFIPRVPGQRIRVPMDLGDKLTGHEVESLTLAEGLQLMAAQKMYWTARIFGPFGNGHGLAGHIAECDPRYPGP